MLAYSLNSTITGPNLTNIKHPMLIGNAEDVEKFSRRLVKVTKTHTEEAKKLLQLMGIPYVEAPCEAEAQCAALAKAGKVSVCVSEFEERIMEIKRGGGGEGGMLGRGGEGSQTHTHRHSDSRPV